MTRFRVFQSARAALVIALLAATAISSTSLPARASLTQAELTSALERALSKNDLALAETMLSQGANPNACWLGCTRTLVDQVLDDRNAAALKLLVRYGAKINLVPVPDGTESTWHPFIPMFEAMRPYSNDYFKMRLDDPVVIMFIAHGGDLNARNPAGNTWLMEQIPTGLPAAELPSILTLQIMRGFDINAVNKAGETAIIRYAHTPSCSGDNAKIVAILIAHGGNPNVKDKTGHTAKDYALMAACEPMLAALAKN